MLFRASGGTDDLQGVGPRRQTAGLYRVDFRMRGFFPVEQEEALLEPALDDPADPEAVRRAAGRRYAAAEPKTGILRIWRHHVNCGFSRLCFFAVRDMIF